MSQKKDADIRSKRATMARETLTILEKGSYLNPEGVIVELAEAINFAVSSSTLIRPGNKNRIKEQADELLKNTAPAGEASIEVTQETTLQAARRLTQREAFSRIACLNFASAKNPGGGFLKGSNAQEESLARSSALYSCLSRFSEMYEANRNYKSALYTNYMIYSPRVPVFRDDAGSLLIEPYFMDIITAPAVNAGVVRSREPHNISRIEEVTRERLDMILALAALHSQEALVLGAYGCGVFKNDPRQVADCFADYLQKGGRYAHFFKHITFAIPAGKDRGYHYRVFQERFLR